MRQMTLKQYRAMDVALFCVILAVTQAVITGAASGWFADQLYVISPVAAVTVIVMLRWGIWAAAPAVVGGVVLSLVSGGSPVHLFIYAAGNLLALAAVPVLRQVGWKTVRDSTQWSLCLAAGVQVLMLAGRMLAALAAGCGLAASWGFVTTDTLSIVFTMVVVWIARRVDGLFEDQKHYLRRIQNEGESEDQSEGGEPV